MGTNFMWKHNIPNKIFLPTGEELEINFNNTDPKIHIAKRSAAGLYCWDDRLTLCRGGSADIHYSRSGWYEACPKCGKKPKKESSITEGAAAVELGFAKPNKKRPTGVGTCSSITWAQDPYRVRHVCEERAKQYIIVDEYGRELTGGEFLEMVKTNCPIEYTDSIGQHFS